MQVFVQDVMTHTTRLFRGDLTFSAAMATLLERQDSMIFITDEQGHLQGVLSDYDLIKARLTGMEADSSIQPLLSHPVAVIEADQHLGEVLGLFREAHCDRVPVVSRGLLVGELDRTSVLRLLLTLEDIGETLESPSDLAASTNESSVPAPQYLKSRAGSRSSIESTAEDEPRF